MTTPDSGEVELRVNGTVYRLALKTAGLAALQKRLSPPGTTIRLDEMLKELDTGIRNQSIDHIVAFLWAALQKHHPGTTEEQAIEIIDELGGIGGLDAKLSELGMASMPDAIDVKELAGPKRANPRKARATRATSGDNSTSAGVSRA